jgi:hypothetical protein
MFTDEGEKGSKGGGDRVRLSHVDTDDFSSIRRMSWTQDRLSSGYGK